MKDKQISLKKLIHGLKNDIKAEKLNYSEIFPNTSYDEKCCSLIRIAYIKDLIERLKDQEEDLLDPDPLY
jgi:hypothetical protein